MDRIEDLLNRLEDVILSGAHEPSERGAGFATTNDAHEEAKEILTNWLNEEQTLGVPFTTSCDLNFEAIKKAIRVHDIKEENGKIILVAGSAVNYSEEVEMLNTAAPGRGGMIVTCLQRRPKMEDLSFKMQKCPMPTFEEFYTGKQKRTNHERQPASYGKGKNRTRRH